MKKEPTKKYDIIIVGGGSVGLTMAACLAQFSADLKIAICDIKPFEIPIDSRASALAVGITNIFATLGIWDKMAKQANPIKTMEITDSGKGDIARPRFLQFEGEIAPNTPFAYMVPNVTTIGVLLDFIKDRVEMISPIDIKGLKSDEFSARLILADGRELEASLIIAADGARSSLRQMVGIKVQGHDYRQTGIVTTIEHEKPHNDTAYEHFRPNGPFASLPLKGNHSSLVWTETSKNAELYKSMAYAELEPIIEQVMGFNLGKVKIIEQVQIFPFKLQIAKSFIANRLALIGDAAHAIHPISGQGMNLGLKDVAALAQILVNAQRLGQDIGAGDVLENYQRWRRFDVASMAMATDNLVHLFSNDIAPIRAIRDVGLGIVDKMPFVKEKLIRHAAAISASGDEVPKLLLGIAI